ncbi:uncharacterized protein LOC127286250 [Leptopilina boulardi]|uniref:uncharacterized protein LOC127286250 n=1 Tax=Leptopilina boulardi TaxID=63433 RepID=UPI0021F51B35|nr:uncharacterized protein LOC127286250 [Leptopilina boulardi]
MFVSTGIIDYATPSTSTEDLSLFTESHIFVRANKIENCFPLSWPEDIQVVINEGVKPDDKMRNEIIRKIVRRMEDNGLMQDADYCDVAQRALQKFPILELRTAAGVETLVSQMKRCSKNHVHYLKLQRRKMSAEDTPAKCHEKIIKMMHQEMAKQSPSINILKNLLIRCRKKRQEDAKRASSVEMHLRDYPALKFQQLVLNEFEAIVGLSLPELRDRWSIAVPKLVNYFAPNDNTWLNKTISQLSVQALQLISTHFKARFGQENRSRHIIEIFEDGTSFDVALPRIQDPPRLIAIGAEDSTSLLVSIYIDGKIEFTGTPIDGLLYLQAVYWVFNLSYASEAKVAFTFLGAVLLQKRYEKSYRKLKRVLNALENLNLF